MGRPLLRLQEVGTGPAERHATWTEFARVIRSVRADRVGRVGDRRVDRDRAGALGVGSAVAAGLGFALAAALWWMYFARFDPDVFDLTGSGPTRPAGVR